MKIISFKKEKDNRYILSFDNGDKIKLYDDVIVEYNLLVFKEMDSKKYYEIIEYNKKLDAYYKALRYIEKRLRCEKEIKKYLEKEYEEEIINQTLFKLKEKGYLNENLYIKSYITDQIHLGNKGPYKIVQDLVKLGFAEEIIQSVLKQYEDDVWLKKLETLIQKKIKTNHSYGSSKLKEKILYDMSNLGYAKWMIEEILKNSAFSSSSKLLEKEYNKIYSKLEKKLSGKELEYQVRQKLFQKGFTYEEINDFLSQ